jgi:hypothetical protein
MPKQCQHCGSINHSDLAECKRCSSSDFKDLDRVELPTIIPFKIPPFYEIITHLFTAVLIEVIPFFCLAYYVLSVSFGHSSSLKPSIFEWVVMILGFVLHFPSILIGLLSGSYILPFLVLTPLMQILFWAMLLAYIEHRRKVKIEQSLNSP